MDNNELVYSAPLLAARGNLLFFLEDRPFLLSLLQSCMYTRTNTDRDSHTKPVQRRQNATAENFVTSESDNLFSLDPFCGCSL